MSDENYTFDPDSLSYQKKQDNKGRKFLIGLISQLLAALVIGVIVFVTIVYTRKTPKQKDLERETAVMKDEYKKLSKQYLEIESVYNDIQNRNKEIYLNVFETELPDGNDEHKKKTAYTKYTENELYAAVKNKINDGKKLLETQQKSSDRLKKLTIENKDDIRKIPSMLPVANPGPEGFYGFGKKLDYMNKMPTMHKGIDIIAKIGTEIYATADGTVSLVGNDKIYGKYIIVTHSNKYKTLYAHLNEFSVRNGQKVKRGDKIGRVGNTGRTISPHLHYEIHYEKKQVNPINYMFASLNTEQWTEISKLTTIKGLSLD